MSIIQSAILDHSEKEIVRRALFLYISELQRQYYSENRIQTEEYESKFAQVDEVIDKLHLRNVPPE